MAETAVLELEASADGRPDALARARAGDMDAFEEVYRRHVGRVFAVCLRIVADRARAEELTQETFVRAWQRLGDFGDEEHLAAWLRVVASNAAISELRSRRGRREDLDLRPEQPDGSPLAGAAPVTAIDLERAIAGLSDRARIVFLLHDVEGLRHDEIGRRLGVTVGTTKTLLHRARRALREALRR